jgi:hypothetical protein
VATVPATSVMSSSQCRTARTSRMNETLSRTTARHAPLLKPSQRSHLLRVLRHSRTGSFGVFPQTKQVERYRLPLRVKLFVDKTVAAQSGLIAPPDRRRDSRNLVSFRRLTWNQQKSKRPNARRKNHRRSLRWDACRRRQREVRVRDSKISWTQTLLYHSRTRVWGAAAGRAPPLGGSSHGDHIEFAELLSARACLRMPRR